MTIQQSHEARFGAGLDDEHAAAFNPAIGRMLDHRSCRLFEVEPVPDNLLHAVLSAAFSAPSKSDLQQRSVIRVRNREKLRRISRYSPAIGWISQAPVFLVWCGDSRRIRRLAEHRGHPFANDEPVYDVTFENVQAKRRQNTTQWINAHREGGQKLVAFINDNENPKAIEDWKKLQKRDK